MKRILFVFILLSLFVSQTKAITISDKMNHKTCFGDDPDGRQSAAKIYWWKFRARLKKIITGKSKIGVRWEKKTYYTKREKRKIDPLFNEYF